MDNPSPSSLLGNLDYILLMNFSDYLIVRHKLQLKLNMHAVGFEVNAPSSVPYAYEAIKLLITQGLKARPSSVAYEIARPTG